MRNPWEDIRLNDYEEHMSLDSVRQLQAMNAIMKEQFAAYDVHTAMVLGIAGGNGLEHVDPEKYRTVYGIDINDEYIKAVRNRYAFLGEALKCFRMDVAEEAESLPKAELVIANLLIEYIGYPAFQKTVRQTEAQYVSCVIQINRDGNTWVSDSPYLHVFDGLDTIHHPIEEGALTAAMNEIGYERILQSSTELPNGKALARLDYRKKE